MKIIKPSVDYWGQVPTDYEGNLRWIEAAGRIAYKSEDRIGPGTAKAFVNRLLAHEPPHGAVIEHSNLVLRSTGHPQPHNTIWTLAKESAFLSTMIFGYAAYIGGNLRAWMEMLELSNPGELYDYFTCHKAWHVCPEGDIPPELQRLSVKFICNRAVSHELVHHRPASFLQESQRFCDYSGELVFIEPWWLQGADSTVQQVFIHNCRRAAADYSWLRTNGLTPQQARVVLPNATKTEIVVTADASEWAWIKKLRTAKVADPSMQEVMNMVPWEEIGI